MSLSNYLPENFDPSATITLIAGAGVYPQLTAQAIRERNIPLTLVAFEDETPNELIDTFESEHVTKIQVGQLGKLLKTLKAYNAKYAIMAGQITPTRLFKDLSSVDLKAITLLATLKKRNAETIFGAIANEIEKAGTHVLDARAFLDNHLASPGTMSGKLKIDQKFVDHGIQIAKEIARLDVGQGVVVRKGTVLAVEAFEGTDKMLERAGTFKTDNALFIKTPKPNQDYRFDVPAFGLNTIQTMANNNIHYAGLEANNTLVLEKDKVLQAAKDHNITLFGYSS